MSLDNVTLYDIGIVGAGPAGLTAAIYALRDNKKVILLEKDLEGGQALNSASIVNIPGFPEISGAEFTDRMLGQIKSFPQADKLLDIEYDNVVDIVKNNDVFEISTEDGRMHRARVIVCATGSTYRTLGVPGERGLIGKGISFCSTCDAPFYMNQEVVVIGGGNSALTEALELANFATKITIYQNLPTLTASQDLIERVRANPKITVQCNTVITGFDSAQGKILYWANTENSQIVGSTDGVFIAIGLSPNNHYMRNIGKIDNQGYIIELIDGAYAAGDCKRITANQVVIACGSGAKAAIKACRYLNTK